MLIGAALLFSTGGAAIKATSITSWQTAGFRSAVAAVALWVFVREARAIGQWRVWAVGVAYASCLVLFVHATKLTTAANAIFLQSAAPAWMLLLGPLLLKEPIRRSDLLYAATLAGGMSLFFAGVQDPQATAPDPLRGNLYGLLSSVAWAFTLAGLRWMAARENPGAALATVTAGNLLAFAFCLPSALPANSMPVNDVLLVLYLGFVQIGAAYWLLTRGMRSVPAFESSTLLLIEPIANPVWTWLLHGERTGRWAVLGGLIILASTFLKTWAARARRG
ncbi:MAG: DMT family transporter [Bryobacteraceae bacterium]|jgi:drug/metabolite transporter, DME family|nr:DMT family transporter [Bryobacteraceae bacterium]